MKKTCRDCKHWNRELANHHHTADGEAIGACTVNVKQPPFPEREATHWCCEFLDAGRENEALQAGIAGAGKVGEG